MTDAPDRSELEPGQHVMYEFDRRGVTVAHGAFVEDPDHDDGQVLLRRPGGKVVRVELDQIIDTDTGVAPKPPNANGRIPVQGFPADDEE